MIYRFYSWRLKEKDNIPGTTVELLMLLPHLFQIASLYAISIYLFPGIKNIKLTKLQLVLVLIGIQLAYHLFIYNKKKWMEYIEEFKDETAQERQRGTNLIIIYTVATYVLFFVCLIALFW
jgi:membrane protease YdiL (CAAX protease family)